MGIRYYKTGGKRYYVIGVSGYRIGFGAASSKKLSTAYSVLDRDWNHEEMARFAPHGLGNPRSSERARQKAEDLAAYLNAQEAAGDLQRPLI